MKFDIIDYVVRYDCLYDSGYKFYKDAFKVNDGMDAPIVRNTNVRNNILNECLGIATLENREDGLVAKCIFNETDLGKIAKDAVNAKEYGLSIYANRIDYDALAYPVTVKNVKSAWVLAITLAPMAGIPKPENSDAGDNGKE